jgi:hypothetical protein
MATAGNREPGAEVCRSIPRRGHNGMPRTFPRPKGNGLRGRALRQDAETLPTLSRLWTASNGTKLVMLADGPDGLNPNSHALLAFSGFTGDGGWFSAASRCSFKPGY